MAATEEASFTDSPPIRCATQRPWLVSRRADGVALTSALLGFIGGYFFFYPRMYSTQDEAAYLAQAFAIRHGHLTLDSLHQDIVQSFVVGHHLVAQYPPGMATVLALASILGWNAALGVNLVIAIVTCLLVARVLGRLGIPRVFAVLYLLYPSTVLFSQTAMSDLLAGLLVIAAITAVLDERPVLVGLFLGASVLVRDANVLACVTVPVGVAVTMSRRHGPGRQRAVATWLVRFACGAAVGGVVAALVYYRVDGGRSYSHIGTFGLHYLPHHLPQLLLGLTVLYPLMLAAPAMLRGRVALPLALTCYGFVFLYGAWFFQAKGSNWAQTLVVSQRFMLVVLPLFVVAYSALLWRVIGRLRLDRTRARYRAAAVVAAIGALLVGALLVQFEIHRHTATLADARAALLRTVGERDLLVCDKEVGKLFLPQWGSRTVYIVAEQPSTLVTDDIRSWKAKPEAGGHRVFVADWAAGGLGGATGGDRSATAIVKSRFATTVVTERAAGLPADLQLLEIAG